MAEFRLLSEESEISTDEYTFTQEYILFYSCRQTLFRIKEIQVMSTAFSNAHLWNIPFVMGDVITSLWSKETPRRMYESKRAKKHKSIQQRLNDCGITYWVLNRFTNCITSKFMLCFTSILCCFTSCLAKQTAHYLLRLLTTNTLLTTFFFTHTTHARRSSGRLKWSMYCISHIKLIRFARMPQQVDPIPNMQK